MTTTSASPPDGAFLPTARLPTGEAGLYLSMLEVQKSSILGLMAFSGVVGLVLACLGHPLAAAAWILACWGADGVSQAEIRRRLAQPPPADPDRAMAGLGRMVLLRGLLATSAPAVVALVKPDAASLVLLMVMCGGQLLIALCHTVLSRKLFWLSAAAPLIAMSLAGLGAAHAPRDLALLGAAAWLGGILLVIDRAAIATKNEWARAQDEKNDLLASMAQARDEAVARSVEAERLRQEAGRASQAKSTFLATMSHEIRTPMNGVLGMAQLLKRSKLDQRQTLQLDTIIQSGEFLLAILNDILDLSKIDAGRMEIARSPMDLRDALRQMLELWRPRAEEKGLALTLHIDPDAPAHVLGDALRLRQILFNLIGNALKFTDKGGVAVRVLTSGEGRVTFQVADTGVGIEAEALPLLFQRFSQVDASEVRRFGGTGLGLAVCKQLAELMDGELAVDSVFGRGSTFSVSLPMIAVAAPDADSADAAAKSGEEPTVGLEVLAVDDNPTNLLVLDHLLHALGHQVTKASGGEEALDSLAARPFDLVLMDIQMPRLSGSETLKRLRAAGGPNAETPVLALTADALSGDRERFMAQGFSEHVTKPIDVPRLVAAMEAALHAGAASQTASVAA